MADPTQSHNRNRFIVISAALAVRTVFLVFAREAPVFEKYLTLGRELFEGRTSSPFSSSPVYSAWIGLLNSGLHLNADSIRIFQLLSGVLVSVLIYEISRRLFSARAALASGLIFACYGPGLIYEADLVTTSLETIVSAGAVLLIMKGIQIGKTGVWLCAGILIGIDAGIRPNLVILIAGMLVILWMGKENLTTKIKTALIFIAGAALPLLPIAYLNHRETGEWILATTSGGSVFYSSNNYRAGGLGYSPPQALTELENQIMNTGRTAVPVEHSLFKYLAERAAGKPLSYHAISSFYSKEAWKFLLNDPARSASFWLRKAYYAFNNYEVLDTASLAAIGQIQRAKMRFLIPFGLLFCFAAVGVTKMRVRPAFMAVLLLFILPHVLTAVMFYVNGRLRASMAPWLAILAGQGLAVFWNEIRERDASVWGSIVLFMGAAAFTFSRDDALKLHEQVTTPAFLHSIKGLGAMNAGRWNDARLELEQAVRLSPLGAREAQSNLAVVYGALGEENLRRNALLRAGGIFPLDELKRMKIEYQPQELEYQLALASAYYRSGDRETAKGIFERLIMDYPEHPDAYYNLGILEKSKETPDWNRALHLCQKALDCGMKFELQSSKARQAIILCLQKLDKEAESKLAATQLQWEESLQVPN